MGALIPDLWFPLLCRQTYRLFRRIIIEEYLLMPGADGAVVIPDGLPEAQG